MDRAISDVLLAVERGATTMKGVIDATAMSRLKVERALQTLEKQKLLMRDGQSLKSTRGPAAGPQPRDCGVCNMCCDVLEVTAVDKERRTVELDGGARSFRTLARLDAAADVTVYRAGGLLQMMMAELAAG